MPRINNHFPLDASMITATRKQILALITTLLGVLSSGVMADTNYSFNFSGDNGSISNGVFVVDGSNLIKGISGTISMWDRDPIYSQSITGLAPVGSYYFNDNIYVPSGSPAYLTAYGVSFFAARVNFTLLDYGVGGSYELYNDYTTSFGPMTSSSIAPEMNASLVPQVGLLLGCLFFLMGRKKEVVEPLLTA